MLDADLRKLLIAQIGNEFAAHALYMGISVYFDRAEPARRGASCSSARPSRRPSTPRRSWTS